MKTSKKFAQRNGCGQSCDDSVWSFVISAVSVMKTNGARNAIAAAISTLWFATPSRNLRRRTAAGGRRRTNGARGRCGRRRHCGTAWCTHLRELRTITSVTANETPSRSTAIADA